MAASDAPSASWPRIGRRRWAHPHLPAVAASKKPEPLVAVHVHEETAKRTQQGPGPGFAFSDYPG